jgi:ribosomal protein S18 acetylase RimI-like enzyme
VAIERTGAGDADQDAFAAFSCCDEDAAPWAEEAEDYIRTRVIREAEVVLAYWDPPGNLVAVAGFSRRAIWVPLSEPQENPGWHLLVLGVLSDRHGEGIGLTVLSDVYKEMSQIDPSRVLVTAMVHEDNVASRRMCQKIGLLPFEAADPGYLLLLGEIPQEM